MNIYLFDPASNTREMLNPCKTGFDACSLQPTNGASDEYAGLLVISKYQESIGQDLGMKSAQYEPRQRSDVAHRHEDQELSIPGCVT